ncbi:hypothetical protein ACS0TY_012055 [Phlomoides rotata]
MILLCRCPYQSCKNCCAKAQNPCHIHVLKGSSSFPDKQPSSGSPLYDQQSTEAPHSGSTHRLRQLSNNFAQFNNLQSPIRSRKPLTKKDAQVINEWRFMKLKEFRNRNMEVESEAFDRYMRNVGLLEEVFQVKSEFDEDTGVCSDSESTHVRMVQAVKLKLRSNSARSDNLRKRIQYIVDQGLKKVGKTESIDGAGALSDIGVERAAKKIKSSSRAERVIALTDLNDKLNKARNHDDLKACWELGAQIFGWKAKTGQMGHGEVQPSGEMDPKDDPSVEKGLYFSPPKWFNVVPVSHEELCQVHAEFLTLQNIEEL